MRLKLLKIAGFKSFVEPTRLVFPSELVGIVGPNGCGKSNILDAVRWVMGESSAKELRGGDMNDVLFNGTDKRKAVSQCSVELLFDNEDGQAGGAYASYAEISVKRVHHREDGTSYFLNQRKCRRKDVIDLFDGTGLGPRSYALIGQGNISRIIEAKPEEMRVYLEEVAGIGPYRSRRKETLVRLERTRENLAQLAVLEDALSDQVHHLAIQAEKAKEYKQAYQRQQTLEKNVYYHQWQKLHIQLSETQTALHQAEKTFSQTKLLWDEAQKSWILKRQQQPEVQQKLETTEAEFHRLDKKLVALSQQQNFSEQQSKQWLAQQALNQSQQEQHQQQLTDLSEQMTLLQEEEQAFEYELERLDEEQQRLDQAWSSMQTQKNQAEQNQHKVHWNAQQAEQRFKQTQQEFLRLEQAIEHQQQQIKLIAQNLEESQASVNQQKIIELQTKLEPLKAQSAQVQTQVTTQQQQKQQFEQTVKKLREQRDHIRQQQQTLQAEQQGLQRIQTASVSELEQTADQLLQQGQAQRLIESLVVEPEWQTAVESWLGARLQGLILHQTPNPHTFFEQTLPQVSLVGWNPTEINIQSNSLAEKIQQPGLVQALAQNVFLLNEQQNVAEQIEQLTTLKQSNNAHHQAWLIDKQGVIYSDFAVIQPVESSAQGVLERQQRIKQLTLEINQLAEQLEQIEQQLDQQNIQLEQQNIEVENSLQIQTEHQREIERYQDQLAHFEQSQTQAQNQLSRYQQTQTDAQNKLQSLQTQQQDLNLDLEALEEQMWQADEAEELASQGLSELLQKLQPIEREREKVQQQLQRIDQQIHQTRQNIQHLSFQTKQVQQQLKQDQTQAALIEKHLTETDQVEVEELDALKQQLEQAEQTLKQQQQANRELTQQLEQAQQAAENTQQQFHQAEQTLVTHQIQMQNLQENIQNLMKTLESDGLSPHELSQMQFDADDPVALEAELKQVKLHLNRLGAVNMTAIEEYDEVQAKLNELEKQIEDLTSSIETLEEAIATIDQDSRQRLVTTFEQVNQAFGELFPKLFHGGYASLSWSDADQDPLEGGVEVMAQPPGKRNSRIQLLSGGEKTLSALALIFAIFQLKPAPFCILDEVDAPLDDSNVIRFGGLVRSLSEKVQFIFITHNKTTMTLAKHLIGVTMHEPGVSRLVSVDLDAAVAMIGESGQ